MKESQVPCDFEIETFRPSPKEFEDFAGYISKIEKLTKKTRAAKIIPPDVYRNNSMCIEGSYKLLNVKTQKVAMDASKSAFEVANNRVNKMSYNAFVKKAQVFEQDLQIPEYEDRFWDNMKSGKKSSMIPLYAIDNELSLFERKSLWNLNKFKYKDSIIHQNHGFLMPGILTSYNYVGMANTFFPFHLEDGDLDSINYLHSGKPKIWYIVPGEEEKKLANLLQELFPECDCDLYLRHKNVMVPPSVLRENGIHFGKIVQNPGEYVVLFSGSCHGGFNCGINAAEAVNFATKEWLNHFPNFRTCSCSYSDNKDGPKQIQNLLNKIYETELKETKTPSKVVDLEPRKISVAPAQEQLNFKCDKCGLSYGLRKNLLYHQRLKHSSYIEQFICPECKPKSLTYSSAYMLKRHLKDHHKKEINIDDILESRKKIRNTKKIEAAYKEKFSKAAIKRKIIECDKCGRACAGTSNLNRHKNKYCLQNKTLSDPKEYMPFYSPSQNTDNQESKGFNWKKRLVFSWKNVQTINGNNV